MTAGIIIGVLVVVAIVIAFLVEERRIAKARNETATVIFALQGLEKFLAESVIELRVSRSLVKQLTDEAGDQKERLTRELESSQAEVTKLEDLLAQLGDAPAIGEHVRRLLLGDDAGPDPDADPDTVA